jgi:hypothetical protein
VLYSGERTGMLLTDTTSEQTSLRPTMLTVLKRLLPRVINVEFLVYFGNFNPHCKWKMNI